jgi:tetratricopeptide (TPR) repeat protein
MMLRYKFSFCLQAFFLAFSLLLFSSQATYASHHPKDAPGPVSDSILQQQRDSIIFQLNLQYLNKVNEQGTPYELISIIEEILALDSSFHNHWFNLGLEYIKIKEYDRALAALNQGLALYPDKDNSTLVQIYISISYCHHQSDRYQQEIEILDSASVIFPDHAGITGRYVINSHARVRYTEAEYYRNKLILLLRSEGYDESDIAFYLGRLYLNTDYLEAEKYFRTAYQYDPGNIEKLGALAWVLIQNALKIDEGMTLMGKALEADPTNAVYLHQQGYGYYMKGNYEAALNNLFRARDLYRQYSFELTKHITMVEQAMADKEEQSAR